MPGVRVEIDYDALRGHFETEEGQAALDHAAEVLQGNAEVNTPPRSPTWRKEDRPWDPMTEGYYWVKVATNRRRLFHKSSLFHLVEFGSVRNPPYSPMRRAVSDAGLTHRFVPDPKGSS